MCSIYCAVCSFQLTVPKIESLLQASNGAGVLPCFIQWGIQKLWSPEKARWLTAAEKHLLMGFPTTQKVAAAYNCGVLDPCVAFKRPHSAIGNSMHVPNCAAILLTALLCIELQEPQVISFVPPRCLHVARFQNQEPGPSSYCTVFVGTRIWVHMGSCCFNYCICCRFPPVTPVPKAGRGKLCCTAVCSVIASLPYVGQAPSLKPQRRKRQEKPPALALIGQCSFVQLWRAVLPLSFASLQVGPNFWANYREQMALEERKNQAAVLCALYQRCWFYCMPILSRTSKKCLSSELPQMRRRLRSESNQVSSTLNSWPKHWKDAGKDNKRPLATGPSTYSKALLCVATNYSPNCN